MWFMMIVSIILTAIGISRMVDPYSPQAMQFAFWIVGLVALGLGLIGLIRLEPRAEISHHREDTYSWGQMTQTILGNRQVAVFFIYLLLLLAALLGQDVLLEPFGGEAFNMTVEATTRITAVWGGATLAALAVAGILEGRISKRVTAQSGNICALVGFILITISGLLVQRSVFFTGVVLLGAGTGLSTVANLSLMLDMTIAQQVGLFIGAWGMSNAFSRLTGSLLAGVVRDVITQVLDNALFGYVAVFALESVLLLAAIVLFYRIDVNAFRRRAEELTLVERAAASD
jgi:BCD family chlorophyll transporter-like MFS transporter